MKDYSEEYLANFIRQYPLSQDEARFVLGFSSCAAEAHAIANLATCGPTVGEIIWGILEVRKWAKTGKIPS